MRSRRFRWFFVSMCVRSVFTGSFIGVFNLPWIEGMTVLVFGLALQALRLRSRAFPAPYSRHSNEGDAR